MNTPATHTEPHAEGVSVRLRLTPEEVKKIDRVRSFLGLRSLSQTAARLATWNADALAVALGALPDEQLNPRAVVRAAILEGAPRRSRGPTGYADAGFRL
jgi:hypothetical protein